MIRLAKADSFLAANEKADLWDGELQEVFQLPGRLYCQASLVGESLSPNPIRYTIIQVAGSESGFRVEMN